MTTYDAFTWMMLRPEGSDTELDSSQYILIDRLIINIETPRHEEPRVAAALKETREEARKHALDFWTAQDEQGGLRLNGAVTVAHVEADLRSLANKYFYLNEVDPVLAAILEQVKTGVPL